MSDWTPGTDAPLDTPLLVTIEDEDGDRAVRSGWPMDSGKTPIVVDGGLDVGERIVAWRYSPEPPPHLPALSAGRGRGDQPQ